MFRQRGTGHNRQGLLTISTDTEQDLIIGILIQFPADPQGDFIHHPQFPLTGQDHLPIQQTALDAPHTDANNTRTLMTLAERIKAKPEELLARAEARSSEIRTLRQAVEKFRSRELLHNAEGFLTSAKTVGGMHVVTTTLHGETGPDEMRRIGDFLRDKDGRIVAVLAAVKGEKITFLAVCGKDAVAAGVRAGDLIRQVCSLCGGKGGGKPDSAMGGGSDPLKLDDAMASVDDFVASKVN